MGISKSGARQLCLQSPLTASNGLLAAQGTPQKTTPQKAHPKCVQAADWTTRLAVLESVEFLKELIEDGKY